ncbi:MAG TPA: threonine--tRNA ligase [bacterium]|nr:threonine--tRNA ligase [bacterium]
MNSEKNTEVKEELIELRHTSSHILAQAVKRLYPDAKLGIGPAIEDGFYYDFYVDKPFTPDDLVRIEEEMKKIVDADYKLERFTLPKEDAIKFLEELDEPFKIELAREIDGEISFYRQGEFVDMCAGPHIESTGGVKYFKLLSTSGAYWKGDEHNPMMQRIYGTSFYTKEELDNYLSFLEEAKKRDHRILGRELDLYSTHEEVGPGLIMWHPNGAIIRNTIEDLWRKEHLKHGYKLVYTPHIASEKIYQISGHLENYAESMYAPIQIDTARYRLKPMNCPGHILIYKTKQRSYRDLPIRYAELGTVYRYERIGTLHGMLRVRGFTQDDAHIFCREDQLIDEIRGAIRFMDFFMKTFGYEYKPYLSTRPEKYIGTDEIWDMATKALKEALRLEGMDYELDEGGGVFYGPKIDIKLIDALGREWQGPTIQVDFNLPERFDVNYTGSDGKEHRVVMIHRTVLGSMERFVGGLIEHYAGKFPLWLAPVQVVVIPISDRHNERATEVKDRLFENDIRVELDDRNEKVNYKVREAIVKKVPYIVVIGDREVENNTLSVRTISEDLGSFSLESFIDRVKEEIEKKL